MVQTTRTTRTTTLKLLDRDARGKNIRENQENINIDFIMALYGPKFIKKCTIK